MACTNWSTSECAPEKSCSCVFKAEPICLVPYSTKISTTGTITPIVTLLARNATRCFMPPKTFSVCRSLTVAGCLLFECLTAPSGAACERRCKPQRSLLHLILQSVTHRGGRCLWVAQQPGQPKATPQSPMRLIRCCCRRYREYHCVFYFLYEQILAGASKFVALLE